LLFKILIFLVIFCSIGYGGKNLYGKYIAKALRDIPVSKTPGTADSADGSEDTDLSGQTSPTDLPENPDTTVNEDLNENPEATQKPDPSMEPEEPDPTSKPEKEEKPKPSEKPEEEEKPVSPEKPEVEEAPDTDGQSKKKASDSEKSEENTAKMDASYFNDAV
ncbi:MAG TPA: hypothetical protein DIW41_02765, partial [Lachnospiraceae bacterium]|nr:hypothetical protein [Lachnospiraceae bacterium]